ncbi:hypothetical protein K3495_g14068 [Podosphaera aphanis]|nr:hypothetical protein K3495_g14068 [Podosphaera aphanis]
MIQSTFDSCLLSRFINGFGIVGLQTDDTLLLTDKLFVNTEETKLKEAKLLAKEREKLTENSPLNFNGSQISKKNDSIFLTQELQCKSLRLVSLKPTNLVGSRGKLRTAVTPKDQFIAQSARGAYIARVCQPEASFDLSYAAQIINPKEEDSKALNKRLQWQLDNPSRSLRFIELDLKHLS